MTTYEMIGTMSATGKSRPIRVNGVSVQDAISRVEKLGFVIDRTTIKVVAMLGPAESPLDDKPTRSTPVRSLPAAARSKSPVLVTAIAIAVTAIIGGAVAVTVSMSPADANSTIAEATSVGSGQESSKAIPVHTVRSASGELVPGRGYEWTQASHSSVRWVAGLRYTEYPHVQTADSEGRWVADAGYDFVSNDSNSFAVRWTPGRRNANYPHISATENEGYWKADAGYVFRAKDALDVDWVPGSADSVHPHILAATEVGQWHPEAGYSWVHPDDASNSGSPPKLLILV